MRTVCQLDMCSNCGACINVCNKEAIKIYDDAQACNAVIDETKCVDCHLCQKACHVASPIQKNSPILWKQGWANDTKIRRKSSSGGLAAAIEKFFVEDGGVVCSCVFDHGNFGFAIVENVEISMI